VPDAKEGEMPKTKRAQGKETAADAPETKRAQGKKDAVDDAPKTKPAVGDDVPPFFYAACWDDVEYCLHQDHAYAHATDMAMFLGFHATADEMRRIADWFCGRAPAAKRMRVFGPGKTENTSQFPASAGYPAVGVWGFCTAAEQAAAAEKAAAEKVAAK
jgi:hypothetical protein